MIEFGKTLRAAREAKGYTIAQVCDLTHLAPSTIEDLENENFSRIAAPIYGRGFVKLYCAAVDLDPKLMVNEFMDIFLGNRDVGIRELPTAAAPSSEQPPVLESEPPVTEPIPVQSTFDNSPDPLTEDFSVPTEDEPRLSRYATPLRTPRIRQIPPSVWRMGLLSLVGLVLVFLLCIGIRALYRATDSRAEATPKSHLPPTTQLASPAKESAPAAPRAPRTPIAIPALYVD